MFLRDSVDDQVYRALRLRCGLFEHFVGAMQPVLALARRMLASQIPADPTVLNKAASQIKSDVLAGETYVDSAAAGTAAPEPLVHRNDFATAMEMLDGSFGPKAERKREGVYALQAPGLGKLVFGLFPEALAKDKKVLPLSPFNPAVQNLAASLLKPGELLPLLFSTHNEDSSRITAAYWLGSTGPIAVTSFTQLSSLLDKWDGKSPQPQHVQHSMNVARESVQDQVKRDNQKASSRFESALARQVFSAQLRLQRELGRYLACWAQSGNDLSGALRQLLSFDRGSSDRIRRCVERLGGEVEWSLQQARELDSWVRQLPEAKRQARLIGSELDAALRDPRWAASAQ